MPPINRTLCPCGSGLRQVRCCALDVATVPPAEATRHLVPLMERATQAQRQGSLETAERLILEVLELAPGALEMLWMLSRRRLNQGKPAATEALVRRIVTLDPNNVVATQDLGLRLMQKGAIAEAEIHARNSVRLAPQNPQSHNLLGMILTEAHRPQIGHFHYKRALELSDQRDPVLLANLAWNLKLQGRMAESRTLFEESYAAAPNVMQMLLGWARMEEADRNFDRAGQLLDEAEQLVPGHHSIRLARAVLHERRNEHSAAVAILDETASMREQGQLGPEEWLQKGRLLDRMGRHGEAFAAFSEGKTLAGKLSGNRYLEDRAQGLVRRLRAFFTVTRLSTLPRAHVRTDVAQPLFILGFPRSGTTLVEQTLSAHPHIEAGDELPFIAELSEVMPRLLTSPLTYPEALAELWMGDRCEGLDSLRDHYLQRARQQGVVTDGASYFTDKMPLNETHLGLIALIFPEAPLVHVLRHPLDVMLSVFSNHLTHGFYCSYALESAARHYVLIADLIAHYKSEMTLRLLTVRYEDIVIDQERQVRRMLDFVGEAFDPGCLRFHENQRYARTASYAQVTEPLYDRSIERWRHYRTELEAIIPILQPVIERLGYSVA